MEIMLSKCDQNSVASFENRITSLFEKIHSNNANIQPNFTCV